ncbi:MAG: diaminopimelate decarboxylase family protein, partial [Actinomycetota bacterium]
MSTISRHLLPDTSTVEGGRLHIGGCDVHELAAQHGTPLFVYDEVHLRARCREAVQAFGEDSVVYATKAFLCTAMARLAHEEGLLLDVATGGELHVALAAGVPARRCVMHGNNKSVRELREAIAAGVRHIVVDSFDELDRIDALVAGGLPAPRVQLRITPGVYVHTHEFVSTGQNDSKFGFNLANGDAERAIHRARASTSVDLVGI